MGQNRGSILGILALIIGIGALGIGGYNLFVQTTQTGQRIGNTWYKSVEGLFSCSPAYTYTTFSDLTIQFSIKSGESAYFSYNGYIFMRLTSPTTGPTSLEVYFSLDGQRLDFPHIEAQDYYDGSTYLRLPASLQYYNSTLTAGAHNITIVLYGNYNINGVMDSTLFVQTYSS